MYKVNVDQFATHALLQPCIKESVVGGTKKTYSEEKSDIVCNFKGKGGTEIVHNGVLTIIDTAEVTMRYQPDLKTGDRLILDDGSIYEVIGAPENIELRNQFLKLKVQRVGG